MTPEQQFVLEAMGVTPLWHSRHAPPIAATAAPIPPAAIVSDTTALTAAPAVAEAPASAPLAEVQAPTEAPAEPDAAEAAPLPAEPMAARLADDCARSRFVLLRHRPDVAARLADFALEHAIEAPFVHQLIERNRLAPPAAASPA